MKRKVTFALSKTHEHPEARDCIYRQAELDIPDESWGSLRPIAIAAETSGPTIDSKDLELYDNTATLIQYSDVGRLVGQVLTYIDATFSDQEQRKAHKDIVNQTIYGWYNDRSRDAEKIIAFAKTFDNPILK